MAKPRVFISSTFFDLKSIRDDLDRFIKNQGFEPVRHERGQIAYGHEERPEKYAYREIDTCDMLVCIIGGRFGTTSYNGTHSITQSELKKALEISKQVYIFVEDGVHKEYTFFQTNKSISGVKYTSVDNPKVHEFLEEIHNLSKGNPIFPFSVASDITALLQEQWAGLFQRLLQENANRQQANLIDELQRSLNTVGQLVQFLSDQNNNNKTTIDDILFENHPLFSELKEILASAYRLYFRTFDEMGVWLSSARGFERLKDETFADSPDHYEWNRTIKTKDKNRQTTLLIAKSLFGQDGRLKPLQYQEWKEEFIILKTHEFKDPQRTNDPDEDDIPF
jgi:hypothetical protein